MEILTKSLTKTNKNNSKTKLIDNYLNNTLICKRFWRKLFEKLSKDFLLLAALFLSKMIISLPSGSNESKSAKEIFRFWL